MIYHSAFRIDMSRAAEWLAVLWQGPAPANIKVREWITLKDFQPQTAILIWEGDEEAKAFVDRKFGEFGELETREVTSSAGMAAAFTRDIDAYRKMMEARGTEPAKLERDVGLRTRGMAAATPEAAIEAARAWKAEG